MGRPTEASDAPAAPSTGGSWDLRSRALVSGPSAAGEPEPGPQRDAADPAGAAGPSGPPPAPPRSPAPHPRAGFSASRRGPADPVKSLMHRHRELCERAVDPLEVAAGLEAHGVTDRTAARYRHRDVFSLAEELFARVPGVAANPATGPEAPERDIATRAAWSLRALLPGAACLATVGALGLTEGTLDGRARLTVALAGALLAVAGLALALRSGPLHAEGRSSGAARVYGCWLLGYVLYGEPLLDQVLSGGPEGPWDITPAPLLGLALALAPATWCAHLFSVHAQRRLIGSRALEEFAAGVRPLLFGAVALHLCALAGLLYLAHLGYGGGAFAGAAALGVLLLLARLLTVHGFPGLAAAWTRLRLRGRGAGPRAGPGRAAARPAFPRPPRRSSRHDVRHRIRTRHRVRRSRARAARRSHRRPLPGVRPHHRPAGRRRPGRRVTTAVPLPSHAPRSRRRGSLPNRTSLLKETPDMTPQSPSPAARRRRRGGAR